MKRYGLFSLLILIIISSCQSVDDSAEPVPDITIPSDIQHFDINNRNDASDIRFFFFYRGPVVNVEEMRMILIPEEKKTQVTLESFYSGENTVLTLPPKSGETRFTFVNTINDFEGNPVRNGQSYALGIAAIHNLDITASEFSVSDESVTLSNTPLRDLYISNSQNSSVVIVDEVTGELVRNFVNPFAGGLAEIWDMIEKPDGDFLITGVGNNSIKAFSSETGSFKGNFTKGYRLVAPTKTAISPDGLIYVSQWLDGRSHVVRFNATDGNFVDEYILDVPFGMGHAWDADLNYYLASVGTEDITKFDPDGNEIMKIGRGVLESPVNLWTDESRNGLFVVDWTKGAVIKFNLETGAYEGELITGLNRVEGFLHGRNNAIYLCDWGDNSIKEYDLISGEFRRVLKVDGLYGPNSVVYGPNVDPISLF